MGVSKYSSVWEEDYKNPGFPQLSQDIKTDVLIIGGGIAGILTAWQLHKRGIDYVLAEKGRILQGVTCGTTAKITSQHGFIYQDIVRLHGVEKARLYYHANQSAIEAFGELARDIDCDFSSLPNYVYSLNDYEKVEKEREALKKIGAEFELCRETELPFEIAGAVKFPNQAQFNPIKLLCALAEKLNIYENTFIESVSGSRAQAQGASITAEHIIVATHFPFINIHGSYPLKLYQSRSYVIALSGAQKLEGMYIDGSKTGLSFRNYGEYLLLGGGSHRTGKSGGKWELLRSAAKKYYPDAKEELHWAAQDCMSLDGIPYIGRYSAATPRLFVASGFNKWGMASSMVASVLLADMVCKKQSALEAVFNPSRSMLYPQLLVNSGESIANLLNLSPKRCTHLGCALKWNSAEHSWDCPCHGSRFSEGGRILNNPAQKDIS